MTNRTRQYGFMLYMTAEEKKQLEDLAKKEDLSQAQVVRKALKLLLKGE